MLLCVAFYGRGDLNSGPFVQSALLTEPCPPPVLTLLLSEIVHDWGMSVHITEEAEEKRYPRITWVGKVEEVEMGCGPSEQAARDVGSCRLDCPVSKVL